MIAAPATLGLLGGGQLGRYFVLAAQRLGYRVVVVDPQPDCPAASVADRHLIAAYDDPAALVRLVAECAAITTEFENVPADALRWLAVQRPVHPSAEAVAVCQNRLVEKEFLVAHGFPLAPFAAIAHSADLEAAADALFPGILKVIRHGYDGKGQVRVRSRAEALDAFAQLGGEACVLEALLPLDGEVSVVLARGVDVNHAYAHNLTALMWAAGYGKAECVQLLLASGADPKLKDDRGKTAADIAQEQGYGDVAALLKT